MSSCALGSDLERISMLRIAETLGALGPRIIGESVSYDVFCCEPAKLIALRFTQMIGSIPGRKICYPECRAWNDLFMALWLGLASRL